jgi:transposase-like protein
MLRVVTDETGGAEMASTLDEIVAEGARRMLAAALEAEVDAYVSALTDERDGTGHRLVVRNGHAQPRTVTTGVALVRAGARFEKGVIIERQDQNRKDAA